MKLGERIRELVDAKNLTHSWVATEAGMTPTTFSRILNGDTEDPSFFTILRIALVINEPISAIAGDAPQIWSNQDLERLATDSAWVASRAVRSRTSTMLDMPSRAKSSERKRVVPVAADRRGALEPESFELPEARIPAEFRKRGADAVFSVIGDSMIGAGYNEGDTVYVTSTRDVHAAANKIVVCTVDGVPLLKLLRIRGQKIVLESAHPDHPPRTIDEDAERFRLRGIVVGHRVGR
ncbi:MAG TPA: XRE family transcriptional regulator [Thermoanaerobaculia bacterium]|nr:XRE family transcriptional regulator [Thermoanaerobaculia bacterium]